MADITQLMYRGEMSLLNSSSNIYSWVIFNMISQTELVSKCKDNIGTSSWDNYFNDYLNIIS